MHLKSEYVNIGHLRKNQLRLASWSQKINPVRQAQAKANSDFNFVVKLIELLILLSIFNSKPSLLKMIFKIFAFNVTTTV